MKVKFAIMGCGYIAAKMAEAVKRLEILGYNVECYAVASRNLERAKEFAKKYGFARAYGSYKALALDSDADLVYIATPHSHHYENSKMCLNAGRNLLVEKAFTANAKQAAELISLAGQKGLFLEEAMWTRFLPVLKNIRTWIANDRIGDVKSVEADFSMNLIAGERIRKPELCGGALLDVGIYSLTFADLFLGNEIKDIQSTCIKYETGVDATDEICITYKNGAHAYLRTSVVLPSHNEGVIYGTKGFVKVYNLNDMQRVELYNAHGEIVETLSPEKLENYYEYEVIACLKAMAEGKRECSEMPHAKTIEFMELMDSLRANWGVVYPYDSAENVWDREGDISILQVYDCCTNEVKVLKEFDSVIEAPNWSADGTFLTYNSKGRIFKYDISTGKSTEVPSYYVDNCNNDHVLSPDGKGLYVSHHTKEDGLSRIYKIFFDGSMPKLVTPLAPSYLHGITPDGKTLCYCAEREGEYDIYTIPTVGGNETRLTNSKGLNDGPEYDADGKYIWFNSVRSGRMQTWRMKADGSEQIQMTNDLHWNSWFPHISPNKKMAVMVAYNEKDVKPNEHVPNKNVELRLMCCNGDYTRAADWSESKTILELFGGQGTINVNSWAPDSKCFAFVSYKKTR